MSRLIGLLALVLIVAMMFPEGRARLIARAQPALDPIYEWNAKNRVKDLAKLVNEEQTLGRSIPPARDFAAFVNHRDMQEDAAQDPWGNDYYLVLQRRSFYIGSAGRDREAGTADDLLSAPQDRRDVPQKRRR